MGIFVYYLLNVIFIKDVEKLMWQKLAVFGKNMAYSVFRADNFNVFIWKSKKS